MSAAPWSFEISDIHEKLSVLQSNCHDASLLKIKAVVPIIPARDAEILHPKLHPPKLGFSSPEGQARMLHDLANIELQAMELGLRTLVEFPDAPAEFRDELLKVTLNEGEHLNLCLQGIDLLGYKWGDWPVHTSLWQAVSHEDSLLDRILIVHRYLEGSGLDAGSTLIKRLEGTSAKGGIQKIIKTINEEEIGHVDFGSQWYFRICKQQGLDPETDFKPRMDRLRVQLPRRVEPIHRELRQKAGFTPDEIKYLEDLRLDFLVRK